DAAAVGGHVHGPEERLALGDAALRIGVADEELQPEHRVGFGGLGEGAGNLHAAGDRRHRGQGGEVLEVVGIVGGAVALGIVGREAVVLGEDEAVGQVDAQQGGRVAAAVLEDRVAQDGVAAVLDRGGVVGRGVAEDGDAAGAVELDQVTQAAEVGVRVEADDGAGHGRLVRLAGAQRRRQVVVAAEHDAVQVVADRGDAVGADAGEVALDDVVLAAVIDLDAGGVEADDVGGRGGGAADRVGVAAGDLDAEDEVAGGSAGGAADGLDAHRASAGRVDADEVALDQVAGGGRHGAADDVDAVDLVPRGDIASPRRRAADDVV